MEESQNTPFNPVPSPTPTFSVALQALHTRYTFFTSSRITLSRLSIPVRAARPPEAPSVLSLPRLENPGRSDSPSPKGGRGYHPLPPSFHIPRKLTLSLYAATRETTEHFLLKIMENPYIYNRHEQIYRHTKVKNRIVGRDFP